MSELGAPEVLVPAELPDPLPGPGQVLIEVEVANIVFVETQVRAGHAPNPAMVPALPAIPGNGVGGTVDGRRVISGTGGTGGYAERVAVDAEGVIDVPDGLELADAVALLADGRTATRLIGAARIQPGETVLVEAAAGGVGSLLVQLAAAAGARVVAAAGGARKVAVARGLGADVAADYTEPGWSDGLEPVDVVFDGVGGEIARAAFDLLRPGGRFCPYGMASGAFAQVPERQGVTVVRGERPSPAEMLAATRSALAEAAAGRLRPVIGQTFPLERAAEAHAAIEARETIGKTLLLVR